MTSKPGRAKAASPFAALAQCYTDLAEGQAATKPLVSDYTSKDLTRMSSPPPKGRLDTFLVYDNPTVDDEATNLSAVVPMVTPSAFPVHDATPPLPAFNKAFLQSLRGGHTAASPTTSFSHGSTVRAEPINRKAVMDSSATTPQQPIKSFTTPNSVCGNTKSVDRFMSVAGKRAPSRFAALPAPVFDENAGETMTPLARSTRKGLSTRRALGEMTNTPLRRKSALKKALTAEASDTVQVSQIQLSFLTC